MTGRHLAWIAVLLVIDSTPAADPRLVRVVLLDNSSSMAGERITAAKAELRELGRALPPAPDQPLIVVPFTDRLGKVVVCTDLATLEDCLDKVEADGGTKIALALERALEELQKYPNCRHASVFLYTDGEDGDQEGIGRQELRLDRLFADREKRGLHQSVIFCKRWQNANAGLLKQIREHGHARVLDAGEARLRPISLKPAVVCVNSAWAGESSLLLDVEFQATLDVVGGKDLVLPGLPLSCDEAKTTGDRTSELFVGRQKTIRLRLPVPLDTGSTLPVRFVVGEARETLAGKDLVLPHVSRDQIVVQVPIPARSGSYTLQGTATPGNTPLWLDPHTRRARLPVDLSVTIEPPKGQSWIGPVQVQAKTVAGWALTPATISVSDNKPQRTSLSLEGRFPEHTPRLSIPIELQVIAAPPGVTFMPATMNVAMEAASPPSVPVTLQHQVRSVSSARWVDPAQAIATFAADIELTIMGPLAPDSEVLVRSPGGVRSVRFTPSLVRPGLQTIRLTIEAELRPKQASRFSFDLLPPKTGDAIDIQPPAPIRLEVTGPPPLQIGLARDGKIPAVLTLESRGRGPGRLRVLPTMLDVQDARLNAAMPVVIVGSDGLNWNASDGAAKLHEPRDLFVSLPEDREVSFFRDTYCDAELQVQPSIPSAALVGSTQTVRLRVEAPFKRYLFNVVGIGGAALAVWFLGRTIYRIVSPEVLAAKQVP